jgi:hypothetical protein
MAALENLQKRSDKRKDGEDHREEDAEADEGEEDVVEEDEAPVEEILILTPPATELELRNGARPMCIHVTAARRETIWLPPDDKRITKAPMQRRLYCLDCGRIKRKGTDKPRKIGYWINVMSEYVDSYIAKERRRGVHVPRITDVQKRLIIQHMEEDEAFNDFYDSSLSIQLERFNAILLQHSIRIPPRVLRQLTDH